MHAPAVAKERLGYFFIEHVGVQQIKSVFLFRWPFTVDNLVSFALYPLRLC